MKLVQSIKNAIVKLFYIEGLTMDQIAAKMGVPVDDVDAVICEYVAEEMAAQNL